MLMCRPNESLDSLGKTALKIAIVFICMYVCMYIYIYTNDSDSPSKGWHGSKRARLLGRKRLCLEVMDSLQGVQVLMA